MKNRRSKQRIILQHSSSDGGNTFSGNEESYNKNRVTTKRSIRRFSLNQLVQSPKRERSNIQLEANDQINNIKQYAKSVGGYIIRSTEPNISNAQLEKDVYSNSNEDLVVEPDILRNQDTQVKKRGSCYNDPSVTYIRESDLNDLIKQQPDDKTVDENLAALAKVILIEHKRSLQMTQTITEDSSISFTPRDSTDSRRDSFSSRQDSSMSMTESEIVRHGAFEARQILIENRSDLLGNNGQLHRRRKNLMRKSKKWSKQIDETDDKVEQQCNETGSSNSQFTDDSNLELNNINTTSNTNSNESPNSVTGNPVEENLFPNNVPINLTDSSYQFAIKNMDSSNFLSNSDCVLLKPTRKLPEVPRSNNFNLKMFVYLILYHTSNSIILNSKSLKSNTV